MTESPNVYPPVYLPAYVYPTYSEIAAKLIQVVEERYKKELESIAELRVVYEKVREILEETKPSFTNELGSGSGVITLTIRLKSDDDIDSVLPLLENFKKVFPRHMWAPETCYHADPHTLTLMFGDKLQVGRSYVLLVRINFNPSQIKGIYVSPAPRTTTSIYANTTITSERFSNFLQS